MEENPAKNKIDLQIHSTASDGVHSPEEILQMAKDGNIDIIAVTDHDTIGGLDSAFRAAAEKSVKIIPGIEISCSDNDIHILGYGIDRSNDELKNKLAEFMENRIEGAKKMVENLIKCGLVLTWEDVLKEAQGSIAKPHIARAALKKEENKEILAGVNNVHDFIQKYLVPGASAYVERKQISAKDGIELIHKTGGVAVWSHPLVPFVIPNGKDESELENFLQELTSFGLDGLETFCPSHNEDNVELVQSLAFKYKLLRTAGSDFHERKTHIRDENDLHSADFLGDYRTYGFSTDEIISELTNAVTSRGGNIL